MAINNLINDSWQGHSHGEVEDALKAFLSSLAQTLSNIGINYDVLIEAITELQGRPAPASWAEAGDSKPSYNVSEIAYAVGKTLAQKLSEMDTAISQAGGSGITQQDINNAVAAAVARLVGSAPTTLDTLGEIAAALQQDEGTLSALLTQIGNKANTADLATVATSGSYNDLTGKPTIKDVWVTTPSTVDGTFTIHVGDDEYVINLNHEHPQYQPLLTAGTNITIAEDQQTGNLVISAAGGSGGISGITMNGSAVTVSNGVANLGTVITQHQSLSGYAKYVLCADEAAYNAIANKDSGTLYLIPES